MRVVPRVMILFIRPGIQATVFRDFFYAQICAEEERRARRVGSKASLPGK